MISFQYKVDFSDGSSEDGLDVSESDDDSEVVVGDADSSESGSERDKSQVEEKKASAKSKVSEPTAVQSKKRTRDGRPKKPSAPVNEGKTIKQEKPHDKGAKDKDDGGKKMMSEKEAYLAVKEYMIKVI